MMITRWFKSVPVFLVWLLGFALAWIILFLWHELLMVFIVNTLQWGKYVVPLVHVLYYCTSGLLMVVYFVLSMEYLSRSARKGKLLRSSLLTIGAPLLIIALAQAGLTLYGFLPADRLGILLMAAEGLAGTGMLVFARHVEEKTR